tara:strand:- start:320 stop:1969 length:1650 start_codon:yes stop_codon:yes gene_type:complete
MKSWFDDLSFAKKVTLPLAIVGLLVIALSVVAINSRSTVSKAVGTVIHQDLPALNILLQTGMNFYRVVVAERSLLNLKVGSEDYEAMLKQHGENLKEIEYNFQKFADLDAKITSDGNYQSLISSFDKWKAITTKIEQERSTDSRIGRSNAMGLSYAEGQQLFEESMVHLNAMIDYIEILSTKESEYVDQVQDQAMLKQVFLLVLALVTCILIAILFPRVITRDLNQINERFTDLAEGGGDLTVRFNTKRTDELGRLSNSFDRFMDKLHSLISEIVHTSDGVGSNVGELNSMSKQAKTSISQQDDSINSVAVAVEKMREALKGIAANTATTADEAKNSQHCTEDGRLLVEQTRSDIQCLTDDVQQVYKAMTRIETGTERIGSVLAVISGIAEQTNLLALNAAIEAARAGEQGRGFAVVADEVRSLASKTQQSTKDINDMIAELENSVSIAVKTMDSAIENAEKTLDSSMKTSESIQEIQASFVKVQNLVGETAKSTEQQYKIIETINGNISAINELSTVSADRAGKVEGSSRRLHQLYQELLQTTNKFKV